MHAFFQQADALLRGRVLFESDTRRALKTFAGYSLLFGLCYGTAMGCFGLWNKEHSEGRFLQIIFSAIKVPLLLQVSFALNLPSFFVFNTLLGVRNDFPLALRALLEAQAALSIVLVSLAPFVLFWYASSSSYEAAVLINLVMFAVASLSAQKTLRDRYRALLSRDARHRFLMWLWIGSYGFIGAQMGWLLRPFVGAPNEPTRFFREGAWGNVYETLARMIWKIFAS